MPLFEYTAAAKEGKIETGQMEALDRQAVISYLKDKKQLVISVKEKQPEIGEILSGKVTPLDRINLTGNLSIMLKAGVSISEALEIIGRDSKSAYFKKVCQDLRYSLENGRSLSEALSHFKNDFDPVFISLIKAGEASSRLEQVLAQLSLQLKKEHSLISKIRSAFAYPIVLVCGLIGVVVLLMTFVLPKLVVLFEASSLKLPLGTRIVFAISRFLSVKPFITLAVIIAVAILLALLLRRQNVKRFFFKLLFHIPVASQLLIGMELTRFSRTLGNLLQSGVSIVKALAITAEAMSLTIYKEKISSAQEDIAKGVSLAKAFKGNEKIFPSMLVSVLQVGEKTGQLDQLLFNLGDFYQEQVDNTLNNLTSLIEPILLVIVGIAIGGMAISIILPIYQLIGSF